MSTFKDMFGLELEVGDTILYPSSSSYEMEEGVLTKIIISLEETYKFEISGKGGWRRRPSKSIINITKLQKLQPSLFI